MKLALFIFTFCFSSLVLTAQFAPQAGISGSDAVPYNSPFIMGWATHCSVQRGWMDIAQPGLGVVSMGDSSLALGMADNLVVSLGDSGVAVLTFSAPIVNGAGADFAVFENGFLNTADNEEAFLELAFVEVSSDGTNFFRFPATSYTQTTQQIAGTGATGTGDYINARQINNLAGKYISKQGTPFDLEELKDITGLDVNNITHVRLVDVVGSLQEHAGKDQNMNIINDPYATPFASGGFDLDAVAVLHQQPNAVNDVDRILMSISPNPASDKVFIQSKEKNVRLVISDVTGKQMLKTVCDFPTEIAFKEYPDGVYFFNFTTTNGNRWTEKVVKY